MGLNSHFKRNIVGLSVYFLVVCWPIWAQATCTDALSENAGVSTHYTQSQAIEAAYNRLLATGYVPLEGQGSPEAWRVDGILDSSLRYRISLSSAIDLLQSGAKSMYDIVDSGAKDFYFQNLIDESNKSIGRSDVLDLFGSGFFAYELSNTSSVTGIRLGPYDTKSYIAQDVMPKDWTRSENHKEVYGDIFNPTTWDKLDQRMGVGHINGFSLVTIKPVGGWSDLIEKWPLDRQVNAIEYILLNSASRMAANGHLYFSAFLICKSDCRLAKQQLSRMTEDIKKQYDFKMRWELSKNNNLNIAITPN